MTDHPHDEELEAIAAAEPEEDEAAHDRFVVLLRHGIAEVGVGMPDADRALTPEGHAKMKQIARGLERVFPRAQAIYASPLRRAAQTALWVAKAYRSRIQVHTDEALASGGPLDGFLAVVRNAKERRVILVGHEPDLTRAMAALLGGADGRALALKKGACYGVRIHQDGRAVLEWLLSPRILRKLAE